MEEIIEGRLITKDKRHEIFGTVAGGAGSMKPEIFQRGVIERETGIPCPKTNTRINLRTHTLHSIACPNIHENGFDYSENFDGIQQVGNNKVFVNLKCIVGVGGSQTRSLREVYWFVEGQINIVLKTSGILFANILDGDTAHAALKHFMYQSNLPNFSDYKSKIYIGDLRGYLMWFKNIV